MWRLRPRCWRTGVGRRTLYRECPNTTKQGRQSLTTCWTNWSKAGSLTLACLTCVRSCWECLTRPSTPRKRSDTALVNVFLLVLNHLVLGGWSIFVENQFSRFFFLIDPGILIVIKVQFLMIHYIDRSFYMSLSTGTLKV